MRIVVLSGGFDLVHSGHISYFNEAKKISDKLIVALNSDECHIIEIQYGSERNEEDIERHSYYFKNENKQR